MSPSITQTRSQQLLERAQALIPGGSQTLSKGPSQWVESLVIERGKGAYVVDVDGNRYLDLASGLGPVILGYQHPAVDAAIRDQLENGITFSLPSPLEAEVAERVRSMVPGAEQVRFMKSGSDVCAAAVRLARIHTGRDVVISSGYHGWQDWYMAGSQYPAGIPKRVQKLTRQIPYGNLDLLRRELREREVACVIVEPDGPSDVLWDICMLTRAHGALVVFDEVITGFRLAEGGAQEHFGVTADLACFGKALGNGMPISALTGPGEIMRDVMFLSSTHAGETLSLAAAQATLDTIRAEPVVDDLWRLGSRLMVGLEDAIRIHGLQDWVSVKGLPPRLIVQVREPVDDGLLRAKSLLQQELLGCGMLFNGNNFINYAMTEDDIDMAIRAYAESFGVLADALPDGLDARLEGEPIRPVFWTR